jgi:hypothetical protein
MLNKNLKIDSIFILTYTLIKCFLVYKLYDLATDISFQLNVAESIYQGHGIQLLQLNEKGFFYSLYLLHPPLTSVLIAGVRCFTDNIITADLIFRFVLVFCEAIVLFKLLNLMFKENRKLVISIFLFFSLYLGHIDRGFTGDYFSFIVLLMFFYFTFLFYQCSKGFNYWLILIFILIIPLTKYTALPFIFFPFISYFFLKKYKGFDISWLKLNLILLTSLVSLFIFLMEVKLIGLSNKISHVNVDNLYYLSRIDYFWFHLGSNVDRIWKHVMWSVERYFNVRILFIHYAQFFTLIFGLILIRRNVKTILKSNITYFLFISIILQCSYLVFLTLNTSPQIGNYGVDSKIWVPIEEARYYNFLTFVLFLFFVIYLSRFNKKYLILIPMILIFNAFSYKNNRGFGFVKTEFDKYCFDKGAKNIDGKLIARFEIISPF